MTKEKTEYTIEETKAHRKQLREMMKDFPDKPDDKPKPTKAEKVKDEKQNEKS